jgi:hypothetical protein
VLRRPARYAGALGDYSHRAGRVAELREAGDRGFQ